MRPIPLDSNDGGQLLGPIRVLDQMRPSPMVGDCEVPSSTGGSGLGCPGIHDHFQKSPELLLQGLKDGLGLAHPLIRLPPQKLPEIEIQGIPLSQIQWVSREGSMEIHSSHDLMEMADHLSCLNDYEEARPPKTKMKELIDDQISSSERRLLNLLRQPGMNVSGKEEEILSLVKEIMNS